MNWNYRIIEHEDRFGLHVVHYTEDGSPQSFRPEPAFVWDIRACAASAMLVWSKYWNVQMIRNLQ